MNNLLTFAQQMLAKRGEFYPFAGVIDTQGKFQAVAGYTGEERPPSQVLVNLLRAGLMRKALLGECRATGLYADVRVELPSGIAMTHAVQVALEHIDGESLTVFLPYEKRRFRGVRYGELFAIPEVPVMFNQDP